MTTDKLMSFDRLPRFLPIYEYLRGLVATVRKKRRRL